MSRQLSHTALLSQSAYVSTADLTAALSIRDLTDPTTGPHAIQSLLTDVVDRLTDSWQIPSTVHRQPPLVSTVDNYDRLGYRPDDVTRDVRYSRHVSPTVMLRSHTSADIPAVLDDLRDEADGYDRLHILPGLVYRRDAVDRTHVGAPHQVDLWRLRRGAPLGAPDLEHMVAALVDAVLPGASWRMVPVTHPYTTDGRQVDVRHGGEWLELAECGLAGPQTLRSSGLDPALWSGLALGMGLDRALMLRKGIDDIRVLRSDDPRIKGQLLDLSPWRPVSLMPPLRRDLSIVVDHEHDEETLGDLARSALGADADLLESLVIMTATAADALPPAAVQRLKIRPGQVNLLVRLTLQALDRTLTDTEANHLRDRVYLVLHAGPVQELITTS